MKRSPVGVAVASSTAALLALSACGSSSSSGASSGTSSAGAAATSAGAAATSAGAAATSAGAAATSAGAAATSAGAAATSAGAAATSAASGSGKSYKMTFVQGVAGDGFYVTMACGIKAEAAKIGNISINVQGPSQFDATLQNPIIAAVTAAKPDALLIAPDDVTASQIPLDQAVAKGLKLVLVDTTVKDPSKAVSQISSDNLAGGAAAFTAVKQLVPKGGKVLVINTKPGISTTDQRTEGFANAAKADSLFNYVGVQYDQDSASIAAQVTSAALQKDPDIVGIFATNLFSAEGAATAIRQVGKSGKIKIAGKVDGEFVDFDYSDDGAGMDSSTLAQLFDPFFTTKRGSGGSGLGAHILYNLVRRLDEDGRHYLSYIFDVNGGVRVRPFRRVD